MAERLGHQEHGKHASLGGFEDFLGTLGIDPPVKSYLLLLHSELLPTLAGNK